MNACAEQIIANRPNAVWIGFAGTAARGDNRSHNSKFFHFMRL